MIIELAVLNTVGMWLANGGYEGVRGGLNDLFNIDTAAIRGRARELYGTSDSRGDEEVPLFGWNPLPGRDPVFTAGGDSPTALTLMAAPEHVLSSLRRTVQGRWTGPACHAFEDYSRVLQDATTAEEHRLRELGDILVELADALEITQYEVAGLCAQLVGIAEFIGGLLLAPWTGGRSVLVSAIGAFSTSLSCLTTRMQFLGPRMDAIGSARSGIAKAATGTSPLELPPSFPLDLEEWFVKTEDPYN